MADWLRVVIIDLPWGPGSEIFTRLETPVCARDLGMGKRSTQGEKTLCDDSPNKYIKHVINACSATVAAEQRRIGGNGSG
jgi:hypothetical protein